VNHAVQAVERPEGTVEVVARKAILGVSSG